MEAEKSQDVFSDMGVDVEAGTSGLVRKVIKCRERHKDFIADPVGINDDGLGCLSKY
jgi:hypothetical protein